MPPPRPQPWHLLPSPHAHLVVPARISGHVQAVSTYIDDDDEDYIATTELSQPYLDLVEFLAAFQENIRRLLMLWTVLSSDLLVFFLAALWFVWAYMKLGVGISGEERREGSMWLLAMVLISPCLVLIDHGHFQYNCISLGLTLGAIAGVLSRNELIAAALFTLAINHKQVHTILDKENFTLKELLDEDEIIQECKALNSILINL
uniref:Alpha-1,3-glucosyltransferase n=2 Tax=Zea mays TaxID=4577 RepID=A0A804R7U0_MAIZE